MIGNEERQISLSSMDHLAQCGMLDHEKWIQVVLSQDKEPLSVCIEVN